MKTERKPCAVSSSHSETAIFRILGVKVRPCPGGAKCLAPRKPSISLTLKKWIVSNTKTAPSFPSGKAGWKRRSAIFSGISPKPENAPRTAWRRKKNGSMRSVHRAIEKIPQREAAQLLNQDRCSAAFQRKRPQRFRGTGLPVPAMPVKIHLEHEQERSCMDLVAGIKTLKFQRVQR